MVLELHLHSKLREMRYLCLFIILFTLWSCEKDTADNQIPSSPVQDVNSVDEMSVPTTFDWSTQKSFELSISSQTTQFITVQDADGQTIQRARLVAGRTLQLELTIASYQEWIYIVTGDQSIQLSLPLQNSALHI